MALRFPRRYTFCEHIGQHVAIPHQAVQEAARAYDLAGQWHSVRDLDQRILQGGHINQAASYRRRVNRINHADIIRGGTAGNIVPDSCSFLAEARSQDERKLGDLVQEMLDACAFAASETECELQSELRKTYRGYRFAKSDDVVRLAAAALGRCGHEVRYALSGGAADANVFNERGLRCVNLTSGVHDFHSPHERIAVADLEAMVDVTVALVECARDAVPVA